MAISKIKTGSIEDGTISTADIANSAVTSAKIDSAYTTSITTNPEFSGTEAAKMPSGTTAQRANAQAGDIRFNTTLSLMEYYDGTVWKAIDAPPTITSISPSYFTAAGETITITGSNFQSGCTIKLVGQNGTDYPASSVTVVSSTSVTFTTTAGMNSADSDPYDVVVSNPSGLTATLADCLDWNPSPIWSTASGTIYNIYDSARGSVSTSVSASDPEGASITYSVTSGSLPSGLSLNSSTGAITGSTSSVVSDTTTTFSISASDGVNTTARSFNIVQKAPVTLSFTATGSSTWTVPTNLTSVNILVVGGGGAGGNNKGGGGGGGGVVVHSAFPVTPAGSISYTVGAGGSGGNTTNPFMPGTDIAGKNGNNSTFSTLTALGGGGGSSDYDNAPTYSGSPGGSGGGSSRGSGYGSGAQPSQPNPGASQYGYPGGSSSQGSPNNTYGAGGGGGAGGAGSPAGPSNGGAGGSGYSWPGNSTVYGGGGGGSGYTAPGGSLTVSGNGGPGGGGKGATGYGSGGSSGSTNTGGGGGGNDASSTYTGGPGIIIIKY